MLKKISLILEQFSIEFLRGRGFESHLWQFGFSTYLLSELYRFKVKFPRNNLLWFDEFLKHENSSKFSNYFNVISGLTLLKSYMTQRLHKDSNPGGAKQNKNHENPWFSTFQGAKLGKNTWS